MPLFKKAPNQPQDTGQGPSDQTGFNMQDPNYPEQAFPTGSQQPPPDAPYPDQGYADQGYPGPAYPEQAPVDPGIDRQHIEEIAEAIIDEKWDELVKNINKIIEWKNRSESRLARIEQEMKDLKDNFDKLHQAVIGKIGEYDKNILHVGTEIKVMEKVFQKILPTFTENVNELNAITKKLKK